MRSSFLLFAIAIAACGGASPVPQTPATPAKSAVKDVPKSNFGPAEIDAALKTAWAAEGTTPTPRCDDATFIRRATIDIAGTIPTEEQTRAFLADPSPDKRTKLVDTLLATPDYAQHWTDYWDEVLMGRQTKGNVVDRVAFRYWLKSRFEANQPWNKLVSDLVAAQGENSAGGKSMNVEKALATDVPLGSGAPAKQDGAVNGAVNWTLRFEKTPTDLAGNASRVFLGVQIQCAQCHDHKTETWKQTDFQKFAASFDHVKVEPLESKEKGTMRRVAVSDVDKVNQKFKKDPELAPIAKQSPTALDGTSLDKGKETRKALADWMTAPQNPWFAKAIVNRMWGHYLGRGFTNPVDDMRPSNPGTLPDLLDRIARDFVAHGYDLKYLTKVITSTEAYHLASTKQAAHKNGDQGENTEDKLWSHFHIAPLGPAELMNAIVRATALDHAAEKAGIDLDAMRLQIVRQYLFLFDVDEEMEAPDYSGTITQALALLNGQLVGQGARAVPGGALDEILAKPGSDADKIDELTLRVLSRKPSDEEKKKWVSYVEVGSQPAKSTIAPPKRAGAGGGVLGKGKLGKATTDPRRSAYEDVLWAMLNSSEFAFNH